MKRNYSHVSQQLWRQVISCLNPAEKVVAGYMEPYWEYEGESKRVILSTDEQVWPLVSKKFRKDLAVAMKILMDVPEISFVRNEAPAATGADKPTNQTGRNPMFQILPDRTESDSIKQTRIPGVNKTAAEFRKQLHWLVKESPDAVKMVITPEMAKVMLERNNSEEWHNRPESPNALKRYTKAMQEGKWVYTGQTIIFSESGYLLNGQHTLHGVCESQTEIESLVAFGVSDEAFKFMDVGTKRTAAHIFAIEGIKNYNFCASVARLLYGYDNGRFSAKGDSSPPSHDDLLGFYYENKQIQESHRIAHAAGKSGLLTPSWCGFLHYICARKNRKAADDFFEKVITGIGITSAKTQEHHLRQRLIKNSQAKADSHEASACTGAYVIKAWNAKRNNRVLRVLRWRTKDNPTETFPRAIG